MRIAAPGWWLRDFNMYGTRGSATSSVNRGTASPCTFSHPTRRLRCHMDGDDFVAVGLGHDLKWMRGEIENTTSLRPK